VTPTPSQSSTTPATPNITTTTSTIKLPPVANDEDDDSPLPTVPPLPRVNGRTRESLETRAVEVDPEQAAAPLEPTSDEQTYDDDTVEH
jgi:hypothetical protein